MGLPLFFEGCLVLPKPHCPGRFHRRFALFKKNPFFVSRHRIPIRPEGTSLEADVQRAMCSINPHFSQGDVDRLF